MRNEKKEWKNKSRTLRGFLWALFSLPPHDCVHTVHEREEKRVGEKEWGKTK